MRISVRGINDGEQYAGSVRSVKKYFCDCDISVSFGVLRREFGFDGKARHCPQIRGTIIASLLVNQRDGQSNKGILEFYVIRDLKYDKACKDGFEAEYLPYLYDWYQSRVSLREESTGVYQMLVDWFDGNFYKTEVRFI